MTILINCTGKFYYGHRNVQNTEAATGGVFKGPIKFPEKHLYQSLNMVAGVGPAILLKRDYGTGFSFELCEAFKNTFFPSACFLKYESFYMRAAVHSCLIKSCSGNIWKISRCISASDCKLQVP